MPLAVYTNDPSVVLYPDQAMSDLLTCIDGDSGLTVDHSDTLGMYLAYLRHMSSFGAQRIDDIVNSSFTGLIAVGAVDSSTYISGTPITSYGGVTFPPDAAGNIAILYDA